MNLSTAWILFGGIVYLGGALNGSQHVGNEIFGVSIAMVATVCCLYKSWRNK
jgi:hypothetical protein